MASSCVKGFLKICWWRDERREEGNGLESMNTMKLRVSFPLWRGRGTQETVGSRVSLMRNIVEVDRINEHSDAIPSFLSALER